MNESIRAFVLDDPEPIRKGMIRDALYTNGTLMDHLSTMTLKEVYAAYKMELATYKRKSMLRRLRGRAAALSAERVHDFFNQLKDS